MVGATDRLNDQRVEIRTQRERAETAERALEQVRRQSREDTRLFVRRVSELEQRLFFDPTPASDRLGVMGKEEEVRLEMRERLSQAEDERLLVLHKVSVLQNRVS